MVDGREQSADRREQPAERRAQTDPEGRWQIVDHRAQTEESSRQNAASRMQTEHTAQSIEGKLNTELYIKKIIKTSNNRNNTRQSPGTLIFATITVSLYACT